MDKIATKLGIETEDNFGTPKDSATVIEMMQTGELNGRKLTDAEKKYLKERYWVLDGKLFTVLDVEGKRRK